MEQRAFENLPKTRMAELSMSRMGYSAIHEPAHRVFEGLESRDLAIRSEDGVSIPMHPFVRAVYLVLYRRHVNTDPGVAALLANGRFAAPPLDLQLEFGDQITVAMTLGRRLGFRWWLQRSVLDSF